MDALPPPRLINDARSAASLFAEIARTPGETAVVAFLDPNWRLLGTLRFSGRPRDVAPSIRTIVRDALAFDAVALVLAHGHPGEDPSPSASDLAFTRQLARTLRTIDMVLVDHLIFAGDRMVSLRDEGLL